MKPARMTALFPTATWTFYGTTFEIVFPVMRQCDAVKRPGVVK